MISATVPRILLIGMMGAGKSTVGSALGERLGWPYLDSDQEIVRRRGLTVPEIWRTEGEPAFRVEESSVLREAAATPEPVVVAVAGGALLEAGNRAVVGHAGLVVWLRAELATLADRVGSGDGRPLLDGDARAALARLYEQRRPVYAAVAELIVDVDGRRPDEVVDVIVEALRAAGWRKQAGDA
ncbi:MAG: shikimate kinase [Actinomycetota bacterium]|nr:shikimate kinase [Actinomycetota bacterium]